PLVPEPGAPGGDRPLADVPRRRRVGRPDDRPLLIAGRTNPVSRAPVRRGRRLLPGRDRAAWGPRSSAASRGGRPRAAGRPTSAPWEAVMQTAYRTFLAMWWIGLGWGWALAGPPRADDREAGPPGSVRLVLAGDIMLDGLPGRAIERGEDVFADLAP